MTQPTDNLTFERLRLDADIPYPIPTTASKPIFKLPKDMNRLDRRAVLSVVERCERLGLGHPYRGLMLD